MCFSPREQNCFLRTINETWRRKCGKTIQCCAMWRQRKSKRHSHARSVLTKFGAF